MRSWPAYPSRSSLLQGTPRPPSDTLKSKTLLTLRTIPSAALRTVLLGATLALPIDAHHSIKGYASRGVSARTGNDYDLIGIAWQYRWGGGL